MSKHPHNDYFENVGRITSCFFSRSDLKIRNTIFFLERDVQCMKKPYENERDVQLMKKPYEKI